MNSQSLARGLAFFSIGLGAAELLAPRQLARAIGVDEKHTNLLRMLGLREIGSGLGIMQGNQAAFLWSRVGGDVLDLGLLASALRSNRGGTNRNRNIGAIAAVAGVAVLDVAAAILFSRNPAQEQWRVQRDDRSGFQREDPLQMRQNSDEAMLRHQSGHLQVGESAAAATPDAATYATSPAAMAWRQETASREFERGD